MSLIGLGRHNVPQVQGLGFPTAQKNCTNSRGTFFFLPAVGGRLTCRFQRDTSLSSSSLEVLSGKMVGQERLRLDCSFKLKGSGEEMWVWGCVAVENTSAAMMVMMGCCRFAHAFKGMHRVESKCLLHRLNHVNFHRQPRLSATFKVLAH